MKQNSKQYSFEEYSRSPQITVSTNTTDIDHTISTEPYRHKKLDNDVLFTRSIENHAPVIYNNAIDLNTNDRAFGNFQSPRMGTISDMGSMTRKESSESQEKFQFKYNGNMEIRPPSRPIDTRIRSKGYNSEMKDRVSTRTDINIPSNVVSAQVLTNNNRLFGNVNNMQSPPPEYRKTEHNSKETRSSYLDNEKMYTYRGVNVLTDDDTRYNEAKVRAYNEKWAIPLKHIYTTLNVDDVGKPCRQSLPDDDTLTKRIFENAPKIDEIEYLKNATNIKVFPLNVDSRATFTRETKSYTKNKSTEKYQFESVPFHDKRDILLPETFLSKKETSRKSQNTKNDRDSNAEYMLRNIGSKPPMKPISKIFPIGVNTTLNS